MDTDVLEEVLNCAICLDRFTNPKVLPCQHTYCLSCLRGLARGKREINCPHCREVQQIPSNGVDGFKDNLVIKKLLEVNFEGNMPTNVQKCQDCNKVVALSKCEHCHEQVCPDCRVTHNKLAIEIKNQLISLHEMSMDGESESDSWKQLEGHFAQEVEKHNIAFKRLKETIDKREHDLKKTLDAFSSVRRIFTGEESIPTTEKDIAHTLRGATSTDALKQLKSNVENTSSIMVKMTYDRGPFAFATDDLDRLEKELESFGEVKYGKRVVALAFDASYLKRPAAPQDAEVDEDDQQPARGNTSAGGNSNTESPRESVLPRGVDYTLKTLMNTQTRTIGPYCTLPKLDTFKVASPSAAVYNPADERIYVACPEVDTVASFDSEGFNAKIAFMAKGPNSMTVADGDLYIAQNDGRIRKGNCTGQFSALLEEQPENVSADLLYYHDGKLLAYDSRVPCVHVLNLDGQLLRSFNITYNVVLGMVVDSNGRVVTSTEDKGKGVVFTYSLDGRLIDRFEVTSDELGDIAGLAVDGDGNLCVARPNSGRVDVYNRQRVFVTSFPSGDPTVKSASPVALAWLPNGKMIVCDSDHNCVNIK